MVDKSVQGEPATETRHPSPQAVVNVLVHDEPKTGIHAADGINDAAAHQHAKTDEGCDFKTCPAILGAPLSGKLMHLFQVAVVDFNLLPCSEIGARTDHANGRVNVHPTQKAVQPTFRHHCVAVQEGDEITFRHR